MLHDQPHPTASGAVTIVGPDAANLADLRWASQTPVRHTRRASGRAVPARLNQPAPVNSIATNR